LKLKSFIMLIWMACATYPAFADEIPDLIASYGSESSREYVLVAEKESQQLFVFSCAGTCEQVNRFACSTGRSSGSKAIEGDNKTPEGIYFFIKIHEQQNLAPIYGIRAFVTDYPNFTDRSDGKTGSEIWLHGTNKTLKDRDSSGCVALENENVQTVSQYITLNRTPIIIVEKLSYSPDAETTEAIRKLLAEWTQAIQSGPYHNYLRFYDNEYLPDMTWWLKWNKARKDTMSVGLKRPGIFRLGDRYVAIFDQILKTAEKETIVGTRKLFLAKKAEEVRIIGDEYQPAAIRGEHPLIAASQIVKTAPVAAAAAASSPDPNHAEIEQMLDQWLEAWSSKDIVRYGEFYASDFHAGMDKNAWLKYKENLNRKYRYIRVSKRDLKIKKDDDAHVSVTFVQSYQSPGLSSVGKKELILKHERGQWKIFREKSRKM
jgi:murein L,D-transpeptidase YafK